MAIATLLCLLCVRCAQAALWLTNSPMLTARQNHTATLLQNGKVLVAGGVGINNCLSSAELYDPGTGKWTATGAMTTNRCYHTATLLPNGKVLVVGGLVGSFPFSGPVYTASAELYNPATETWTATTPMPGARGDHTATLLLDGTVLVAGGDSMLLSNRIYQTQTALFNPATETWASTGSLRAARELHTATLLSSGQVLVVGGFSSTGVVASAELYNPVTHQWAFTSTPTSARYAHVAIALPGGKVLVAGGANDGFPGPSPSPPGTELFDSTNRTWATTAALSTTRGYCSASLLPNGSVLISGGIGGSGPIAGDLSSAELYAPGTGTWTTTAAMRSKRSQHTSTLLQNGRVLVAGGSSNSVPLASTELYDSCTATGTATGALAGRGYGRTATLLPNGLVLAAGRAGSATTTNAELYNATAGSWSVASPLTARRYDHTATLLPTGRVLITGGWNSTSASLSSAELFDAGADTWTIATPLLSARASHTATLLTNGMVLVAGGNNNAALAAAEIYNPATGIWTNTGALKTARWGHTATLLVNGTVLVAGGQSSASSALTSSEIFSPVTGVWTNTGSLKSAHRRHTATLLPNGKVLVAGGQDGSATSLASAELFDPVAGTWSLTAPLSVTRDYHTATLLLNGHVLVAAGHSSTNGVLASTELYDPAFGTWKASSALSIARQWHTATLLPTGKVLLVAGAGTDWSDPLSSAELYDVGLGFSNSWRPQISAITPNLKPGGSLVVTGAQFRGLSSASGGGTQDSSTDHPLLQLHSLASGWTTFLRATNWSTNSFVSVPLTNFPIGFALATVFVNGIPSASSIINFGTSPTPILTRLTEPKHLPNGSFQFTFTNAPGAIFSVLASTDASLPLSNWTALGGVTEVSPGQFQFTDPQAVTNPQRFYRLRSP